MSQERNETQERPEESSNQEEPRSALSQPLTIGTLLLVVIVAVFRVVVWPMIQDRMGYGVGCKVLDSEDGATKALTCRLSGNSAKAVKYCWTMTLGCKGKKEPVVAKPCRVVARDQNLELRFPQKELQRAGCTEPLEVKVSDVRRKRLVL